jgi:hypothetical protein
MSNTGQIRAVEAKKTRPQIRLYLQPDTAAEMERLMKTFPFLKETDVASMIFNAGLAAVTAHGYPIPMPLKLNVESPDGPALHRQIKYNEPGAKR